MYSYEARPASGAAGGAFDAAAYAKGVFASKIVPTVHSKAVDAGTLLAAIKADANAAGTKYGRQSGTGSPYAFMIKGSGTVTKVDPTDPRDR